MVRNERSNGIHSVSFPPIRSPREVNAPANVPYARAVRPLLSCPAAVNRECRAGHVRRRIRAQIKHQLPDVADGDELT